MSPKSARNILRHSPAIEAVVEHRGDDFVECRKRAGRNLTGRQELIE